jgi:hypothetical protein
MAASQSMLLYALELRHSLNSHKGRAANRMRDTSCALTPEDFSLWAIALQIRTPNVSRHQKWKPLYKDAHSRKHTRSTGTVQNAVI